MSDDENEVRHNPDSTLPDGQDSENSDAIESFNQDTFARVSRLSKIELVTIIATAAVPGIAHGACACSY